MTLETDSRGNYRASRLTTTWIPASQDNAARVGPTFKARTLKARILKFKERTLKNRLSWLFMAGTLLISASVIRMWSHWFEISASLGFYRAAGILGAVTGAAIIVSWWLNTGNG